MKETIAFHGTALWKKIRDEGRFEPFPEDRVFDDTAGSLASCGGTYLAVSPRVAAVYALKAEQEFFTVPTVVAVGVREDLLISDEDKVWIVVERFLDRHARNWKKLDAEEARRAVSVLPGSVLEELARSLGGSNEDPGREILRAGVLGFIVRYNEDDEFGSALEDVNVLCSCYRAPVTEEWNRKMAAQAGIWARTFRTMVPIGEAEGTRIIGAATLVFTNKGMTLSKVVVEGDFPEDTIPEIVESVVEYLEENGTEITAAYETSHPDVAPAAGMQACPSAR